MKKIVLNIFLLVGIVIAISSCKKDGYFVGGELHNPKINMTTYDWMKSNKYGVFDTVLMLIDKAGVKEKINAPGITFFAPTDYDVYNYVQRRTAAIQKIDPNKMWTVDSIMKYELNKFADSLDIYIAKEGILNSSLTEKGKKYKNAKGGEFIASYEETRDPNLGYNPNSNVIPRVVMFTYLFKPIDNDFDVTTIVPPVGSRTLVQTSNAQTTTGVVHVLSNSHVLFFYR
ncbi:hypothetical protein LZQ00_17620 [Sphingobacterium sp. SRCM116780]|uniref:hypothetical protein n=1 Tax=Sphingobacterium sp. SRCM116780 TaxID=2907623 RepID=UPI001F19FE5F|nr:hypothetical protein [Sphingobacterium sp. SRCM116780]UIR56069.1 hypothetical protein LZQ00_17620 [Sphingobacterium sp. SRCM116780]